MDASCQILVFDRCLFQEHVSTRFPSTHTAGKHEQKHTQTGLSKHKWGKKYACNFQLMNRERNNPPIKLQGLRQHRFMWIIYFRDCLPISASSRRKDPRAKCLDNTEVYFKDLHLSFSVVLSVKVERLFKLLHLNLLYSQKYVYIWRCIKLSLHLVTCSHRQI